MSRQNELFGKKCRDKITGYVGVCTDRIIWLYGCDKYTLKQLSEDNKDSKQLTKCFDEQSLVVIEPVVEVPLNRDELGNQEKFFGKLCRDKVTLFEGICTGRMTSIFGCDSYCLSPRSKKKNKYLASEWFDEGRLEVIGEGVSVEEVTTDRPGGEDSYPTFAAEYAILQ